MQILRQWQTLTALGIVFGVFFAVHFAGTDEPVRAMALSILGIIGTFLVMGIGVFNYIKDDPFL